MFWADPPAAARTRAEDWEPVRMPWPLRLVLAVGLVVWVLAIIGARSLFAQVAPVVTISGGNAVTQVQNTARTAVTVTVELRHDSTSADRIGGPVLALVSPQTFTLGPQASQTVRIRLRAPWPAGTVLRLLWTLTPQADGPAIAPASLAVAHVTMVSRIAAKVLVTP